MPPEEVEVTKDGAQTSEEKPKVTSESLKQMMMLASNLDDS